jgi:hypothetical protein
MCLVVQAEAAALTAFRAGSKGSSAAVVASLQAGAAYLFEKAAKVVREYTGEGGKGVCVCVGGGGEGGGIERVERGGRGERELRK